MNVFVLDLDPGRAARILCDQHVGKMLIESVQLLSTAYPEAQAPCRRTKAQYNNGYARWARESRANWAWLCSYARGLAFQWWEWKEAQHGVVLKLAWMRSSPPELKWASPATGPSGFMVRRDGKWDREEDPTGFYRAYYAAKVEAWRVKGKQATWDRPGVSPWLPIGKQPPDAQAR